MTLKKTHFVTPTNRLRIFLIDFFFVTIFIYKINLKKTRDDFEDSQTKKLVLGSLIKFRFDYMVELCGISRPENELNQTKDMRI